MAQEALLCHRIFESRLYLRTFPNFRVTFGTLSLPRSYIFLSNCGTFICSPFLSADWCAMIPGTVIANDS